MRRFFALIVLGLLAAPSLAQPFYARGTFGDEIAGGGDRWNDLSFVMTEEEPGHYTRTIGSPELYFPDVPFNFKLAEADYDPQAPSGDARVVTNNDGEVNFHLYTNTNWTDGWYPRDQMRAGYDDPQQFGWEISGDFNDFGGAAEWHMTAMGDGLYHLEKTFDAGSYEFKFRRQGTWDVSVGGNGTFANGGDNNDFRVWNDGDTWNFDLDLPNGRWRAYTNVPSPDLNEDDYVDILDYVEWKMNDGTQPVYDAFAKHYGATPPPPPPGWYARGDFNGFAANEDSLMEDLGGGHSTITIDVNVADPVDRNYQYKIARSDWSQETPGPTNPNSNNGSVRADATTRQIVFHHYETTSWSDGWFPNNQRRVGYEDHQQFDWQLMGNFFDNFANPIDMVDLGDGLHQSVDVVITTANTYQFKFRSDNGAASWDVNIGSNFANHGSNASMALGVGTWKFELDLPRGAWRVYEVFAVGSANAVPEPASAALAMLGLLAMTALTGRQRRG